MLLPLDDLLAVIREFINADVSRSGLDRCLRRHGVSELRALVPSVEGKATPVKTFKDYKPGFLHIDIKYLPQMPDETHRRYLVVAIDRATRWVFMRSYRDQSDKSSTDFLRRLRRAAPMRIKTTLTDNGSQFTDRFTSTAKSASGQHVFDSTCLSMGIEHRLCPPKHPKTNGKVERFNGRINDIVKQTRFSSAAELDDTLANYLVTYNHLIPQRALKHQSPIQALRNLTRRICQSAANVASYATGPRDRAAQGSLSAAKAAASKRCRRPACGFAWGSWLYAELFQRNAVVGQQIRKTLGASRRPTCPA